ncbi:MAG TPA: SprT family zinc-dependent metalloprotease, partial [Herpetosiphonaceae bacterium]|nr:SprT family zinc-dependent metalloprotease [Herpetosiphonaceae bacterium]
MGRKRASDPEIRTIDCGAAAITFELGYSRRKTLGISVHRDGRVAVKAPLGSDPAAVERIVRRRAGWIVKQQQVFAAQPPPRAPLQYRAGESHRYLGRDYRLRVLAGAAERVALDGEHLLVVARDTAPDRVERLLAAWYRAEAARIFAERLAACFPLVAGWGVAYPRLSVRRMRARWGSCGASGHILLNLRLIHRRQELIDYVMFHELCHLKEHNHSPRFYALLDNVLPDWRRLRQELNAGGAGQGE